MNILIADNADLAVFSVDLNWFHLATDTDLSQISKFLESYLLPELEGGKDSWIAQGKIVTRVKQDGI